jgi:hypothetical protein
MGISLNGLTPAGTYPGLIKTGDNTAISGTPKVLSDGNGNNLPMEVSTTEVNFTNQLKQGGVAVPTASQVAAKQDTLVSGTNIKTINGTSVLGSGNIVTPSTPPSGVAGAIQFSAGSAFNSDAANFFWDNTNKRLGVGTNAPSVPLEVLGNAWVNAAANADATFSIGNPSRRWDVKALQSGAYYQVVYNNGLIGQSIDYLGNVAFGNVAALSARVGIKGSGSTSATTAFLVQNSAGTNIFKIGDSARIDVLGTIGSMDFSSFYQIFSSGNQSTVGCYKSQQAFSVDGSRLCVNVAGGSHSASASFQVDSTTTGILPPRMTTTQKNNIATPAAGLVVYDSTTNKLQCYNGSTWNDLF